MTKSIFQLLLAGLLLAVLSPIAQAQYGGGYGYNPHPLAVLQLLARQGAVYQRPYFARSSCQPTRQSDSSSYGQGQSNSYADLQVQNEFDRARVFWDKRRLRQQYQDEQRKRRRFTQADVAALREHRDSLRPILEINHELAVDRARRQSPDRPDVQEVNPVNGQIHWPATLRDAQFTAARIRVENLFAERAGYDDFAAVGSSEIPRLTRAMTDTLKSMVHDMPGGEYVAAKKFLKQLEFESRFAPPAAGLAAR